MSAAEILAKHTARVETEQAERVRLAQEILAENPDMVAFARNMREVFGDGVKMRKVTKVTQEAGGK